MRGEGEEGVGREASGERKGKEGRRRKTEEEGEGETRMKE